MPNPTDEVRPDIKASKNPMEIRNDGGCYICGFPDYKNPNHGPPAIPEQCDFVYPSPPKHKSFFGSLFG